MKSRKQRKTVPEILEEAHDPAYWQEIGPKLLSNCFALSQLVNRSLQFNFTGAGHNYRIHSTLTICEAFLDRVIKGTFNIDCPFEVRDRVFCIPQGNGIVEKKTTKHITIRIESMGLPITLTYAEANDRVLFIPYTEPK